MLLVVKGQQLFIKHNCKFKVESLVELYINIYDAFSPRNILQWLELYIFITRIIFYYATSQAAHSSHCHNLVLALHISCRADLGVGDSDLQT